MKKKNKARRYILAGLICLAAIAAGVVFIFYPIWEAKRDDQIVKEEAMEKYGVNRELTGTDYDSALAAVCDNGTFIGRETEGAYSFKGIPYAKPPVGELRWKPPVDAGPDDGVYEAWYFGKSGIQTEADTERASYYPQGEDCLTLNVWTCPDEAGAAASQTRRKKAVMVFFHGGAYGWGGTADPIYDGQNFVKAHGDSLFIYTDGVTEGTNAALEEIFVNIANYAYGNREGEAQIAFSYEEKNKMIEMVFSDRGIPFDPTNRPAPDITGKPVNRPIGGLGIHIVRKTMDEVKYRYEGGKNVLTIRKSISEEP